MAMSERRLAGWAAPYISAAVRITAGLLWFTNLAWKRPPDFGVETGRGLFRFTMMGIEHPIFPPYTWVLENLVLPNFTLFGWVVLLMETVLATLLIVGAFTRVAALAGAAQSAVIGLTVAAGPGEWGWSYVLMVAIHLAILAMPQATYWSVDSLRSLRGTEMKVPAVQAGRRGIAAAVFGYGLLVAFLAFDRPFVGTDAINLGVIGVQGTVVLALLFGLVAIALFLAAGRQMARWLALLFLLLAALALALYGTQANVLSAGPTSAAVVGGAAAFLLASAPPRVRTNGT